MHIEPGIIVPTKVILANLAAVALLGRHATGLLQSPTAPLRTLLAALFFSLFMESFHLTVGPSELHFVGAMAVYLSFGYLPTLFGFALGLLLQGGLFEPSDLPHLAVNSLSLIIPLIGVHHLRGQRLLEQRIPLGWREIVRLDALYYTGVTTMVGFWLMVSEVNTPWTAWASFALSYLAVVALEPLLTMATVRWLKKRETHSLIGQCCQVRTLRIKA
ncbi:MAG: energy-coupling factor ABC transporter permease [Magnetococcales bacterium]|nr:energy-coupling factor ABC transporter permease [Magnetococcales bacterium]